MANADICNRCGEPVYRVGTWTFDLIPPRGPFVTPNYIITIDSEGHEDAVPLSGAALGDAQKDGVRLFYRHNVTCSGYWPR